MPQLLCNNVVGKRSCDLLDIAGTDMTTHEPKSTELKKRCAQKFEIVLEKRRRDESTAARMRKHGTLITLTFKKSEWEKHVVAFEEEKKKETDEELARLKEEMNKLKQENKNRSRRSVALHLVEKLHQDITLNAQRNKKLNVRHFGR